MVPGHEIVGRVSRTGAEVNRFKPGNQVGVGCFVDSCRTCSPCQSGQENYCENGPLFTYNSKDKAGNVTRGGYSSHIVVNENYVLRIPEGLSPERAAPLLCAGITTYSPLKHWKVGPGTVPGGGGARGVGAHGCQVWGLPGREGDRVQHFSVKNATKPSSWEPTFCFNERERRHGRAFRLL
jgi:uncharacterized zinc-type alcohol dehydrogenase-like protein